MDAGVCKRPSISCYARSGAQLWDPIDPRKYPSDLPSAQAAVAALKRGAGRAKFVSAEKNRADGEVPCGQPYLWTQLLQAQADLFRDQAHADLILIDAGANDVGITHVLERFWTAHDMGTAVSKLSGNIAPFLTAVRSAEALQSAAVVAYGYYEAFTMGSQAGADAKLSWFLDGVADIVIDWPRAAILSTAFRASFQGLLSSEVDRANDALGHAGDERRIRGCFPDFGDNNGMFTPQARVWGPGPDGNAVDPMKDARAAVCSKLDNDTLEDFFTCPRASFGHPDVAGARAYADAIMAALTSAAAPAKVAA